MAAQACEGRSRSRSRDLLEGVRRMVRNRHLAIPHVRWWARQVLNLHLSRVRRYRVPAPTCGFSTTRCQGYNRATRVSVRIGLYCLLFLLRQFAARLAPRRSLRPYDPIIPRNLSRPVRYGGASSLACSCRANVVDELATLTGSLRNTGPAARHLVWPPGSGVGVDGVLKQRCERLGEIGDAVRRDRAADRWPLERDTGAVYDGASRATSNQTLSSSSCPSDPGALAPAAHRPTSEAVGTDATPVPSRVQVHHRRTREDDVIGAGVQIPQPPPLFWRLLAQQFKHGSVMCVLSVTSVRQHDPRVRLEDGWDGGGNGQARGCAVGDPRDPGACPDAPRAAFPRQPNNGTSVDTLAGAKRAVRALTA